MEKRWRVLCRDRAIGTIEVDLDRYNTGGYGDRVNQVTFPGLLPGAGFGQTVLTICRDATGAVIGLATDDPESLNHLPRFHPWRDDRPPPKCG